MYMYFPTNYVWSMAVVASLNNGGLIDDVDKAVRAAHTAFGLDGDGTAVVYAGTGR